MDKPAGEGVLDGHHGSVGQARLHGPVQVLEGVALDDGRGFIGIEPAGRLLMEATLVPLYGNPFHAPFQKKGHPVRTAQHKVHTYEDTMSGYYRCG